MRTFPAHGQQVAAKPQAHPYIARPRAASGGRRQRKRVPIRPTGNRETWPVARSRLRPHDSGAAGPFAPCHHARSAARSLATASSSARSSSVAHASDSARNCSRARKISRASVARRKTSDRVSPGRRSFSNREIVSSSTRKLMTAHTPVLPRLEPTATLDGAPAPPMGNSPRWEDERRSQRHHEMETPRIQSHPHPPRADRLFGRACGSSTWISRNPGWWAHDRRASDPHWPFHPDAGAPGGRRAPGAAFGFLRPSESRHLPGRRW